MPPTNPAAPKAAFGQLLRDLRTTAGKTQAQTGRRIHVTEDAVATYEKGRSLPDEAAAVELDRWLGAHGALHQAWLDAQPDSRPDSAPVGLSAHSLLATATREAADFGAWAEQRTLGEAAITTLTIQAAALADDALTAPPAQVAGQAAHLAARVFTLLRARQTPRHARDLYLIAGQVSALLAWLCGDLGALDAALVHGATAQTCAELADQPELTAWVAAVRSKTAYWRQDYRQAAELAEHALERAAPGTVRVMLACQRADAHAALGDLRAVADALTCAQGEAEHVAGPDSLGGLFSCKPARHANYASSARIALGDPAGALAETDRALAQFDTGPGYGFGTIAQVRLSRVYAHAAAGDLEGAASALRPVLDLPPDRRLATLTGRLRPLLADLSRPAVRSSRVAAPLRQEIAEFCGAGAQRAITAGGES